MRSGQSGSLQGGTTLFTEREAAILLSDSSDEAVFVSSLEIDCGRKQERLPSIHEKKTSSTNKKTFPSFAGVTTVLSAALRSLQHTLHQSKKAWQDAQMLPFALLIDGENFSAGLAVSLLAEAGKFGSLPIRRMYGNWSHPCMKRWQNMVIHYGMTPVQHHLPTAGKNATDIALVVDAMELYAHGMRRFCLENSDCDTLLWFDGYVNMAASLSASGNRKR